MKKVMLISPMLHQGGFERICVMTARLLQIEYEVVIVVFSMEDIAFDISGLKVIDLNLKAQTGKIGKMINVFKRCRALTRLQKEMGTDISYSFGMTANIANALSRGAKKKITACHSFEEIKSRFYMRLIGRGSDKVLCCSKKMADLVEETYALSNVTALWNPCDIEGILDQSRKEADEDIAFWTSEDTVLVSMGREDDIKGFWHLLKVFRRVYENNQNTKLAIIGDGDFSQYEKLAGELGIEGRVLFAGLKKNPFPYLKASDFYILTSLSEGLPNALVEALVLSLPVISVNCLSGPAEILHEDFKTAEEKKSVFMADFGIITPVLDPEKDMQVRWEEEGKVKLEHSEEQLAQAITDVIKDAETAQKYRMGALKRAENFSKEKYMAGLVACMENL